MFIKPDPFRDDPALPIWATPPGVHHGHDCFADEIAIDFPSVTRLLDRVRDGLLSEAEREPFGLLRTDVLLSHDEAHRGTIVPLEVELRGTCSLCGGRGEIWSDRCTECHGTGNSLTRRAVKALIPPGISHGACVRFRLRSPSAPPLRVEIRIAVRVS